MTVYKDGEPKQSIDKSVRSNLLVMAEESPDQVPPDVADVIQCATDIWASSVAKFKRMDELADAEDHRVRGAFIFNGGSATGRLASYGLQLQNMARKVAKDPIAVREAMLASKPLAPDFGKSVSEVLKSMIRPAIMPEPGHVFVVADWNSVEARVNPWLTAHELAEEKLDVFREGRDVYIVNAAATFQTTYEEIYEEYDTTGSSDRRQVGKVQELALGFSGSVGAFAAMGRIYGVNLPESEALKMVYAWRRANPWSVDHSRNVEEAYTRAMRNPNTEFSAGRVTYLFDGLHLWYALPSGRILNYPYAKLDSEGVSYAKASWKPAADAKEWPRARLWKGLAVENTVQATANDLLRHSLRQIPNVVLTAHDEIVVECETHEATKVMRKMREVMCKSPAWASELPLDVDIKVMNRYGK
jgi:DNA polymerase